MPGTNATAMSEAMLAGKSEEGILNAITNANESVISKEKKGKKAKK